jgi:hypothetical protein
MRQQLDLTQFASKLSNDRFKKADYLADTRHLKFWNTEEGLRLHLGEDPFTAKKLKINNHFHSQIAAKLNIPKKHYDRLCVDYPDVLATMVNRIFEVEHDRRMVRALDGTARAYLSDKFRTDMDNYDVANAAIPILEDVPGMNIKSLAITDTRMYIKAGFPRLRADVGLGDTVEAGVVISNSEVGASSLRIEALIYRLVCLNGMIAGTLLKKFHVGTKHDLNDEAYAVLSQATREKSAEATKAVIADIVKVAADATQFEVRVQKLRDAKEQRIDGDVPKAIEALGNQLNLTQDEQSSVLTRIIEGGDLSRWGLANAVTRVAADIDDYDRATEFERMGGEVIELNKKDWAEISVAA